MDSQDLRIIPPFGYDEVVPLRPEDRVLMPRGATPSFCREINAVPISAGELPLAARDYPVVFASREGSFTTMAVLGIVDRQNLFMSKAGDWEAGVYLPAYVRRYPFCISRIHTAAGERQERLVCVARAYLDSQGILLYDEQGKPTAEWEHYSTLLSEFEDDLDVTTAMCRTLAQLELISEFRFQVMDGENARVTLQGMYRVDESRLAALPADRLKQLLDQGVLSKVYAHIHSLANFDTLYRRALERAAYEKRQREQAISR